MLADQARSQKIASDGAQNSAMGPFIKDSLTIG